ncbi:putative lipid II flippase FtsW [Paenibacillus validus]|uniref:Probable peptidoglycan glycosyltransferase FtsW n=1 Tax=Paenibacillus validus TaxID=44253 RepID=A0A7X2ZFD5_9BACL|nr:MULTISPECIES: putative lipid II flippase FtsW [Paenibacillus]MED4600795.1 putative lipid II flippase FtsW [Paenibacillus validus]MED4606926.1 putative lipid II flippase FtsW [Paenibacillus validus]MUG73126.1 putative lipid II flippase FtsW [Paenibacillus validus]
MNSPRRGTPDFLLLFLTFLLVCIGLAFVFSASVAMNDPWSLVIRQGLAVGLGTVIMFFCMNVDFRKFQKWVAPFLTFSIVLLLLVPIVGREVNNAKSWIYIGSFGLQPTELAKLAVILYLAALLSKKGDKIHDFKRGLVPPLLVVGFLCMLIMFQPDLGSTMIVVLSAALVIVVGGASIKHIMLLGAAGASALALLASVYLLKTGGDSYRVDRFTTFLDPFADPQGGSFQIVQSLYAFGHGGLTGAGFGQSVQKLHYLPEAHNDFIFSIIGEELGFIGSSIFLIIYLVFLLRGLIVALRCKDLFGMLAGVGIVGMIGIQAFINIGGVTNTIPMTGVTLPLISQGGTSMLVTLMSLGILLSISREYNRPDKEREPGKKLNERRWAR